MHLAFLLQAEEKFDSATKCLQRALQVRPRDIVARYHLATIALHDDGKINSARRDLETVIKEAPTFTEAQVTLTTVYCRLKRKEHGDREPATVHSLNRATQAKQPPTTRIQ